MTPTALHSNFYLLFVVLISGTVTGTKYRFESNVVRKITEEPAETVENHGSSRICESLLEAEKLVQVCKLIVNNDNNRHRFHHRRVEFFDEQPSQRVISVETRKLGGADTDKRTLTACKCPTNQSIYLTDGKSAGTIRVVVEGRGIRNPPGRMSARRIHSQSERKMKYLRYIKTLRRLKGKKSHKKKYEFRFGAGGEGEEEGSNFNLEGLADLVPAADDAGLWDGVASFLGGLDLGGLEFDF